MQKNLKVAASLNSIPWGNPCFRKYMLQPLHLICHTSQFCLIYSPKFYHTIIIQTKKTKTVSQLLVIVITLFTSHKLKLFKQICMQICQITEFLTDLYVDLSNHRFLFVLICIKWIGMTAMHQYEFCRTHNPRFRLFRCSSRIRCAIE